MAISHSLKLQALGLSAQICAASLFKKNKKFPIYKEIQNAEQLQSHIWMKKGFLIYEKMRKYLTIYKEAVSLYDFATAPF
jgi:hypothetical protein